MEGGTPYRGGGVGNTLLGGGEGGEGGGEEKSQCSPPPSMKHCKANICSRLSLIFLASFQVMLSLLLKSSPPPFKLMVFIEVCHAATEPQLLRDSHTPFCLFISAVSVEASSTGQDSV